MTWRGTFRGATEGAGRCHLVGVYSVVLSVTFFGCASVTSDAGLCVPSSLEGSTSLALYSLPQGCSFNAVGNTNAPQVIRSQEALAGVVSCEGRSLPQLDLANFELWLIAYAIGPAYAGVEVFDDGTTVTFLSRSRLPCASDIMPAPMNGVLGFMMPKGTTRQHAEASCTLPQSCD